ncbi:hypothetical protein HBI81_165730 [Parastagonospora nodorum]|nr:hypothetical protein HBH43_224990 [Parastagonospora nodorum]KAH4181661.1 hypothetical protein HBH42_232610 [Parastagonospora nodorum]KAH4570083.1 hypothetical protein HBH83_227500 [Parastagonospora nodorum]KAH4817348.1 hypothetical protein HBH60_207090 [Parastagonospora nodorum]KAH5002773.1 hypothetical protein HBI74_239800 [Parastagonospora nodorum]
MPRNCAFLLAEEEAVWPGPATTFDTSSSSCLIEKFPGLVAKDNPGWRRSCLAAPLYRRPRPATPFSYIVVDDYLVGRPLICSHLRYLAPTAARPLAAVCKSRSVDRPEVCSSAN